MQEQKCEKLSAVISSKLFLHEYENNTHEAEQALPAWRGAGRSSRGTRPLLSSSGGARSFREPHQAAATRQAGRACSASCVLFSYSCRNSFDLMTAESFSHFCSRNFSHQLKSLTIPEAIRHLTREKQEHRVTSTHSVAAPSACGSFCPMCDFLGRMVLLTKRLRSNFCAAALVWFAKGRDLVAFLRCKHTPQAIGSAAAKTQQRRAPSTLAAAVSRG